MTQTPQKQSRASDCQLWKCLTRRRVSTPKRGASSRCLATIALLCLVTLPASAQRQMERLGRGVTAFHRGSGDVYVGWRLLGTDPADIGFNVYRSVNSAAATKLNSAPLTNTTDYVDGTVNFTSTNAYFIKPVIAGVEQAPSATFKLPANSPSRQYLSIPMQPIPDGGPYQCFQVQVGDVDADGEFELICLRHYIGTNSPTFRSMKLDCYRLDGTFLWRVDSGTNYTGIANNSGYFTVIDLDGDGRSEVSLATAKGTTFADGATIATVSGDYNITNSDGHVISGREFLSVLDGATGKELARTDFQPAQTSNPYGVWGANERPWYLWMAAGYLDGVHASIVTQRGIGGDQHQVYAWDFRRSASGTNGTITQRWRWSPPTGGGMGVSHNMLIYDVNNDGKDDIVNIGGVINSDGTLLYNNGLVHGDHFRVADMDPDRPGPELFAIQQNNPNLVGMGLYDAATGKPIKAYYMAQIGDLGRGDAGDYDGGSRGVEFFSTMANMYDCKGNPINSNHQFPSWGIWWDADLQREIMTGAGADGTASVINKWYPNNGAGSDGRLYSIYTEGVHQNYGGWPLAWGDYTGDWREETIQEANTYNEIRVYSTTIPAMNRLYSLMQNAAYRVGNNCKGRIGASFTDYYLGGGMAPPPPPAFSDARLVWRGGVAGNTWDNGVTANWATNWFWLANGGTTNPPAIAFTAGQTLLFDATGSNSAPIILSGSLAPGDFKVQSPNDYTFAGTGVLAGAMKLTKNGTGKLILNTTNTFSGPTLICEGPVIVNGSLTASPVTVRGGLNLAGRIGGNGSVGAGVRVEIGGGVSPGNGKGYAGTLTVSNGVTMLGGAINDFDLSDDPTGSAKTNDMLNIVGNLSLAGTNTLVINPVNTNLAPGVYTLIKYSGALTGSLANLAFTGIPGVPASLTNPPGAIGLVVRSTRLPASIVWAGPGTNWDLSVSSNWLNGATRDIFVARDTVRFDNSGAATPTINLVFSLPSSSVSVDTVSNYSFTGNGRISGAGGLSKYGPSTLSIQTINDYTGPTIVGGGTLSVASIDIAGTPSSLGASGNSPTNLVFFSSTLRYLGAMANTDRGATLNGAGATIDVAANGGTLVMTAPLIGTGGLTKNGPGTLTLNAANTYTGGTVINSGTLQLGTQTANVSGLGTGTVTLNGGTLGMINIQGSETAAWSLTVPTNMTGGLVVDGRCGLSGTLTGGGTLNVTIPYVRSDFRGNWSAFAGWINVSGSNFRCSSSAGYPKARLHFNSGASLQNLLGGTPNIPIGELSGDAGATVSAPGGNDGVGVTWRVGGLNTSASFDGTIANNVGLIKEGSGAWSLTGANTYTSGTAVNGGALLVNNTAGSGTGTGSVTVNSGAALGGGGTIAGAVTIANGGKLAPNGTLTISNNLVLNSTSVSRFDLGATDDLVVVAGNLALSGKFDVTNNGDFFSSTNVLFAYAGALTGPGLTLGTVLPFFNYTISTNTPGQVKLIALSTVPLPPAPTNLAAIASNAIVFLNWSATTNTLSYHVKRSLVSGGPFTDIAVGVTGTSFSDTTVANGSAYYYVVSASNGSGEGLTSAQAGALPPGIVPDVPTGLTAVAGNQMVALDWNLATYAAMYNVKRSTNSGGPYTNIVTGLTDTAWYDLGLAAGRTYYYVVSGVNLNGESSNSVQVSATPILIPTAYWTNKITSTPQNWDANNNWTNVAAFPNGVGAVAVMKADITVNQTNQLNQDTTLGVLALGDANNTSAYTIAGNGGSLIFDNNGIPATLTQISTSKGDTIAAPILLNDALVISNLSANALTLSGVVSGTNAALTVSGGNVTVTAANTYEGGSTVNSGTLQVNSGGGVGTGTVTLLGGTYFMNNSGPGNSIDVASSGTLQTSGLIYPPFSLSGAGQLNLSIGSSGVFSPGGNWTAFNGTITFVGNNGMRAMSGNVCSGNAIWNLGSGTAGINNKNGGYTIYLGALTGGSGTSLSGATTTLASLTTYVIGGRNTNCTFSGRIMDGGAGATALTKVGSATLILAGTNTYTGNTVISGGTLQVGAGGTSGSLTSASISDNATLAFNRSDAVTYSGSITGTGGLTKLGSGTLTLTGPNTYSGLTRIHGGTLALTDSGLMTHTTGYSLTNEAILDASALTGGLALTTGQTLSGSGSVLGTAIVGDSATLSPGDSIGRLSFSNSLTLSPLSTTIMDISKAPFTNDQVVAQSLGFGGALVVNLLGALPLAAGDSFKLFSTPLPSGSFAEMQLPTLGPDLAWYTNALLTSGTIMVVSTAPPLLRGVVLNGHTFVLSATGGTPGWPCYLLASTNVSLPLGQWPRVGTNYFDASGSLCFTNTSAAGIAAQFNALQVP